MNLTSGEIYFDTQCVEDKLTIKDIAKLIRLCRANGVSSLKFGVLELSIGTTDHLSITPSPQVRGSAKKAIEVSEIAATQMQFDEAQEMASTLHLEDPLSFEQLLAANGLEKENYR